jgi:hypothetical protein
MERQKETYPNERTCRGCKLGYEHGERDLSKAKCEIKVCFFEKKVWRPAPIVLTVLVRFLASSGAKGDGNMGSTRSSLNSSRTTVIRSS